MSTREDPELNIVTGRYEYEDETGQSWEQDPGTKSWRPICSEEEISAQQAAYSIPGVDETAPLTKPKGKKRKAGEGFTGLEDDSKKAEKPKDGPKSGSVYVSGLPLDVTIEELTETFSKCGILAEDAVTGQSRIILYNNDDGSFKGDALVVYFREESVSLAITMLDDVDLRGDGNRITVSKAVFKSKEQKTTTTSVQKRGRSKVMKLKAKLNDWEEDDMNPLKRQQLDQAMRSKHDRVVILQNMFTLSELDDDPTLLLDLKEDVREESEAIGKILSVTLFDLDPHGSMSVKFEDEEDALKAVKLFEGRYFAGRRVKAFVATGEEKFKKRGKGVSDDEDERLEKFGSWLES